jgi:hypothetical protein
MYKSLSGEATRRIPPDATGLFAVDMKHVLTR